MEYVQKLAVDDYNQLLENNSKRYQSEELAEKPKKCEKNDRNEVKVNHNESPLNILQEQLINSICSPIVINAIKSEFLKRRNAVIN